MATKPPTVTTIRAAIAALRADAASIENAEPNRAERVAGIEAHCRAAAAAGDQRIAHHIATDNPGEVFVLRCMPDGTVNAAGLFAALTGPDKLAAELCRHIPEGPGGLPAAERAERLAAIAAELFGAEVAEERLIEASEAAGVPIARRPDADPRAVLGMHEPRDDAAVQPVFETAPRQQTTAAGRVTHSTYMARKPA